MPRRIGRLRPVAGRLTAAPVVGIAAVAFLPAAAKPPAIPEADLPYIGLLVYCFSFVALLVFGIWGFRIGTGWRDEGNGGGGSKGPEAEPPRPSGGRELTDDFPAWEEQLGAPEREPAASDRPDKVSAGTP